MERSVPSRPPRWSFGMFKKGFLPASNAMPRAIKQMPMMMVTHGRCFSMERASGVTMSPKSPNTTTNPEVIAAETVSARVIALTFPPGCSVPRKVERYAGRSANPHGFTVAAIPAAMARAYGPWSTFRKPRLVALSSNPNSEVRPTHVVRNEPYQGLSAPNFAHIGCHNFNGSDRGFSGVRGNQSVVNIYRYFSTYDPQTNDRGIWEGI